MGLTENEKKKWISEKKEPWKREMFHTTPRENFSLRQTSLEIEKQTISIVNTASFYIALLSFFVS